MLTWNLSSSEFIFKYINRSERGVSARSLVRTGLEILLLMCNAEHVQERSLSRVFLDSLPFKKCTSSSVCRHHNYQFSVYCVAQSFISMVVTYRDFFWTLRLRFLRNSDTNRVCFESRHWRMLNSKVGVLGQQYPSKHEIYFTFAARLAIASNKNTEIIVNAEKTYLN